MIHGDRDLAGQPPRAMWLMLQQGEPSDYVIGGVEHSVQDFADLAFAHVGLEHEKHVVVDQKFVRPAEVDHLVGDASKARRELGWEPKVSFQELVEMMVDADMERLSSEPEPQHRPAVVL
jgi:GDPmannose 4,6-dehydratase